MALGLASASDRAQVFIVASMLLDYPDDQFFMHVTELEDVLNSVVASPAVEHLRAFCAWMTASGPVAVRRHYVENLDMRRRGSLYLSHDRYGDTRKRGMALLSLKQRYRAAGFIPGDRELPDYLPLMLAFAALAGPQRGEAVLRQHRAAIERLHRELTDRASAYALPVDAVRCLLGPFDGPLPSDDELDVPMEMLGLEPYGFTPAAIDGLRSER